MWKNAFHKKKKNLRVKVNRGLALTGVQTTGPRSALLRWYWYHLNLSYMYISTTMNLQIVLNTAKNPCLNQATTKILSNFFYPKKTQSWKYQTQK